jgi:hypothetical protein
MPTITSQPTAMSTYQPVLSPPDDDDGVTLMSVL